MHPPIRSELRKLRLEVGEERTLRGEHRQRRVPVEKVAHQRGAAAVRAADEDRPVSKPKPGFDRRLLESGRFSALRGFPYGLGPRARGADEHAVDRSAWRAGLQRGVEHALAVDDRRKHRTAS